MLYIRKKLIKAIELQDRAYYCCCNFQKKHYITYMQHIISTVRNTLARKEYSTQMIARISLNELAVFFDKKQLEGYIRHSILFVELQDQSEIIILFREKHNILNKVNTILNNYGYTKPIKDIRHKKMRSKEISDWYN